MEESKLACDSQPAGEVLFSNQAQLELLRAVMESGMPLRTRVRGASMMPSIRDNDAVVVVPLGREAKVGDIVAFVSPRTDRLVFHRIVARRDEGWLARGDNCRASDGVIARDQILGHVVRVERPGRLSLLGAGPTGTLVAWLSRRGMLIRYRSAVRAPRRLVAFGLSQVQRANLYRRAGRRMLGVVSILDGSEAKAGQPWGGRGDMAGWAAVFSTVGKVATRWAAVRKGRVLGIAEVVVGDTGSVWEGQWISSLVVRGRYRRLGLGESLCRRVLQEAAGRGASAVTVAVLEGERPAECFCRKLGFEPVVIDSLERDLQEEERLQGRRRILMRRKLAADTAKPVADGSGGRQADALEDSPPDAPPNGGVAR